MADITLVVSSDNSTLSNYINNISPYVTFDAVKEVSFKYDSEVTSYPTEEGMPLTDNIKSKNPTYTVVGYISKNGRGSLGEITSGSNNRIANTLAFFKSLKDTQKTISINTSYEILTDLVINGISATETLKSTNILEFNLSLTKIRTGKRKVVAIHEVSNSNNSSGSDVSKDTDKVTNSSATSTCLSAIASDFKTNFPNAAKFLGFGDNDNTGASSGTQ